MPTHKPYLIVPLIVDALVERSGRRNFVIGSLADFSLLPYVDLKPTLQGFRKVSKENVPLDRNSDTAYLSENIVAQPFGDLNTLEPGVHLHWAIPPGLTVGRHPPLMGKPGLDLTRTVFPCA